MRLRIVKNPTVARIDGIQLDYLVVGVQYEFGSTVGNLLLSEGWAEPVEGEAVDDRRISTAPPTSVPHPRNPRELRKPLPAYPANDKRRR